MDFSDTYNRIANQKPPSRRGLITGLAALIAAPALVRATSIMPVKVWADPVVTGLDFGSRDWTAYSVLVWSDEGEWRSKWIPLSEPSWISARSPSPVQSHQRELPMLIGPRHG